MFSKPRATVLVLMIGACIVGCKAKPAPESGFLDESAKMKSNPHLPFNKGYWNRAIAREKFTELYIAPVNTKYVMAQNFWERSNEVQVSEADIRKSLEEIAKYTQDSFKKAAADDPQKRFTVVEKAGPNTIVLEMAIVQLVPSKVVLNTLGFVSWIPTAVSVVGSTITSSEDQGKGVIAIEARLRDGRTGEVVGMFADREHPPVALVDIKSLNWWAPCKAVIDDWSRQFVELANNPGRKVADTKAFELLVW